MFNKYFNNDSKLKGHFYFIIIIIVINCSILQPKAQIIYKNEGNKTEALVQRFLTTKFILKTNVSTINQSYLEYYKKNTNTEFEVTNPNDPYNKFDFKTTGLPNFQLIYMACNLNKSIGFIYYYVGLNTQPLTVLEIYTINGHAEINNFVHIDLGTNKSVSFSKLKKIIKKGNEIKYEDFPTNPN